MHSAGTQSPAGSGHATRLIVIAPDLPAAARRMYGIESDRPLVLAAAIREQLLVVHPAQPSLVS